MSAHDLLVTAHFITRHINTSSRQHTTCHKSSHKHTIYQ